MKVKMVRRLFVVLLLVMFFSFLILHANSVVWQPQVGDFRITNYPDFGEIVDRKSHSLTITCIEGSGSAQVSFTKEPNNALLTINPPVLGANILSEGDSSTATFEIINLGASAPTDFSITATVSNSLGEITDSKIAYGTLLIKPVENPLEINNSETQTQSDNNQLYIIIILIAVVVLLVGIIIRIKNPKRDR